MQAASARRGSIDSRSFLFSGLLILAIFLPVCAQKIALITPDETTQSQKFSAALRDSLKSDFEILDDSMSFSAFGALRPENAFNLSVEEARNIGSAIGCDFYLLVKSETLPRSTFARPEYFEAYAVVFAVSTRTGRLIWWNLRHSDGVTASQAQSGLVGLAPAAASEAGKAILRSFSSEPHEPPLPAIEEPPAEGSPAAKDFRPALPYKRIKPLYPDIAQIYGVEATIDIVIDVDKAGRITRSEITRWAGFGLDGSVTDAVLSMQWRPAYRGKNPLPLRVLLRYNFRKPEKEVQKDDQRR